MLLRSERFLIICYRRLSESHQALGSDVGFEGFSFGWHGVGRVELYESFAALLHISILRCFADLLRVQVTISSFLHRSWYVNELVIEHPVVRVLADRGARTCLTQSSANSQSNTSVFDLGIHGIPY